MNFHTIAPILRLNICIRRGLSIVETSDCEIVVGATREATHIDSIFRALRDAVITCVCSESNPPEGIHTNYWANLAAFTSLDVVFLFSLNHQGATNRKLSFQFANQIEIVELMNNVGNR